MEETLAALLREQYRLRIGREMAKYLIKRLADSNASIGVIGDHALTGVPLHQQLPADELRQKLQALQMSKSV